VQFKCLQTKNKNVVYWRKMLNLRGNNSICVKTYEGRNQIFMKIFVTMEIS
jgi:hypothetical protein